MSEQVALWFTGLPKEWVVFLISMLPIVELRGAIPWGLSPAMGGSLGWGPTALISIAGNMLPIYPLLRFLGPLAEAVSRRSRRAERFFGWLFARARRKGGVVERYGPLGLILFVGIPLPGTGAWTGALVAFLLGMRLGTAIACILAGVLLAALAVTLASLGVFALIGL